MVEPAAPPRRKGLHPLTWLVLLLAFCAVLFANVWDYGGTILAGGTFHSRGCPFRYYWAHPSWDGQTWDYEHLQSGFLWQGACLNVVCATLGLAATAWACEAWIRWLNRDGL